MENSTMATDLDLNGSCTYYSDQTRQGCNLTNNSSRDHPPQTASSSASIPLTAFQLIYIAVGTLGIAGNLLALVVIVCDKKLRQKLHNLFIISQCLIDVIIKILLFPTILITVTSTSFAACLLWQSRHFFGGLYMSSIYSIAALAVKRYLEVVHPVLHRLHATARKITIAMLLCCVLCPLYKILIAYTGILVVNGACRTGTYSSVTIGRVVGALNLLLEYLSPLLIILSSYAAIARCLSTRIQPRSGPQIPDHQQQQQPAKSPLSRAKRNVIKTSIIVVTYFVACTTFKQSILFLFYSSIIALNPASLEFNLAQLTSSASSCIYPYIYLTSHAEFNKGARRLLACKGFGRNAGVDIGGAAAGEARESGQTSTQGSVTPKALVRATQESDFVYAG